MSIRNALRELVKRKSNGPLTVAAKQPENLYLAIQKYKDRPDYALRYKHKPLPGDLAKHVQDIPIVDTLEVAKNIEDFISSKWGGGHWQIQILSDDNKVLATYQLSIAGSVYNAKTGKKSHPDDPDSDGGGRRRNSPYDEVLAKVVEKTLTQNPMEMMTQLAAVIAQFAGGSSKMEDLAEQMLVTRFNNDVSKDESDIDRVKGIIEIGRMFAPAVPAEDTISSLIQAAPAFLSTFMAMKAGSTTNAPPGVVAAPALAQNNGGLDVGALRSLAASIPTEMLKGLPPDQQYAVQQLLSTAKPAAPETQGVTLPRPGEDVAAGVEAGTSSIPDITPSAAGHNPHHAAIDVMVEEIRTDLRGEATDNEVAQKMLAMVTAARGFTSSEPHPLLKGIMEADEQTGAAEFRRFCQAIPELGRDYERIESIEREIVLVMEQGAAATQNAIGNESGPELPETDLDFAYETEAEQQAAVEQNNVNVSGSTGVPRSGAEIGTGRGADRVADEEPRPADDYKAEAV